jgi:hypothetical protein
MLALIPIQEEPEGTAVMLGSEHPLPQILEIDRKAHREMKIVRSDSNIFSAPGKTASLSRIQNPKGQNPLRRPFASFRLTFRLEETDQLASRSPASSALLALSR